MRIKFEIDKNNRNEFMNVDDDYDNTDISIKINEEGNQVVTILINRDLILDGDERYEIPPIEEIE